MPQRFSDPFAVVRSLAQRRSGMFDPAKERRRVTALERSARARSGRDGFRPPAASAPPECDDATYGTGVTVYSDTHDDRLQMCVTTGDGQFASRPLAFADEQLIRGFASSGSCNSNQSTNAAAAQTLTINVGTQYQWQCLITGTVAGVGEVDIRLESPVSTGWHNIGRGGETSSADAHRHSISDSGNHKHTLEEFGDHAHAITGSGNHTHGMQNAGGHSHTTGWDIDTNNVTYSTTENGRHNHGTNAKTGEPVIPRGGTPVPSHTHGLTAHEGHSHSVTIPRHRHGTDGAGSHSHTIDGAGGHNHNGWTGQAGGHRHTVNDNGAHDHGGNTGNGGGHSHTVDSTAAGTVTRVADVTGSANVRLEYRSASGKQARCYSAALTAVCWRVG